MTQSQVTQRTSNSSSSTKWPLNWLYLSNSRAKMLVVKCSVVAYLLHLRWAMPLYKPKTCPPRVSQSKWSKEVLQAYASRLKSPPLYYLSQWLVWLARSVATRTTTMLQWRAKRSKVFLNLMKAMTWLKIAKQWSRRDIRSSTSATGMVLLKTGMKRAGQALGTTMTIWVDPLWWVLMRLKTRGQKSQVFISRSKVN